MNDIWRVELYPELSEEQKTNVKNQVTKGKGLSAVVNSKTYDYIICGFDDEPSQNQAKIICDALNNEATMYTSAEVTQIYRMAYGHGRKQIEPLTDESVIRHADFFKKNFKSLQPKDQDHDNKN